MRAGPGPSSGEAPAAGVTSSQEFFDVATRRRRAQSKQTMARLISLLLGIVLVGANALVLMCDIRCNGRALTPERSMNSLSFPCGQHSRGKLPLSPRSQRPAPTQKQHCSSHGCCVMFKPASAAVTVVVSAASIGLVSSAASSEYSKTAASPGFGSWLIFGCPPKFQAASLSLRI